MKLKYFLITLVILMPLIFFIGLRFLFLNLELSQSEELKIETKPAEAKTIAKQETIELVGIAPIDNLKQEEKEIKLLFTGDLMFDRYIRSVANQRGNDYIFGNLKPLFLEQDLVITNLEGPITNNPSISLGTPMGTAQNLTFTFDPSLTKTLVEHNINLVNLGNNHILNFGEAGFKSTLKELEKQNIEFFYQINQQNQTNIQNFSGLKIGFVNYNQFLGTKEEAVNQIKNLRNQVDLLIVYTHWGSEYRTVSSSSIQNTAHLFIDSGTDLIIGSHPHVIQQSEVYKGKKIYYSLGNFIFDQYFQKNTMQGLMIKVKIDPKTKDLSFEEIQIEILRDGRTQC
jgi:poly-gamma-glutamate synthesis protein (capsule biosynthesis protein)